MACLFAVAVWVGRGRGSPPIRRVSPWCVTHETAVLWQRQYHAGENTFILRKPVVFPPYEGPWPFLQEMP